VATVDNTSNRDMANSRDIANSKVILLSRAAMINNINSKATSNNTRLKTKALRPLADKTRLVRLNKVASNTANNRTNSAPMTQATHKANQATMVNPNSNMAAATPTLKINPTNNKCPAKVNNKAKVYLRIYRTTSSLANLLTPTLPTTTRMLLP